MSDNSDTYSPSQATPATMERQMSSTIASRYNAKVLAIMPGMAVDLVVDPAITDANTIDEIVFRRSEFLGGMAAVILALVADDKTDAAALTPNTGTPS
jgi:hypothetical protein